MSAKPNAELIAPLRRIKEEYVDESLRFYKRRAPWFRRAYRGAGVFTIVASFSLPVLASAGGRYQTELLPAMGVLLGVVSALNAFYSLQTTWQKFITTQLVLEGLIAAWEIDIAEAAAKPTTEACQEAAGGATRRLVANTRSVLTSEASKFFENLKWPAAKGAGT